MQLAVTKPMTNYLVISIVLNDDLLIAALSQ